MASTNISLQTTLYKRSKSGKIQQWTIFVCEDAFMTTEGFVDGQLTDTDWTFAEPKNVGRSTETTPEEQAIKEAEARIQKQRDKGWVDSVKEAETHKVKIAPMLAHKIQDNLSYIENKDCVLQGKLDGQRNIATIDGQFTRSGKPVVACQHIFEALEGFFKQYPTLKTDGELYNHAYKNDFNAIVSITKKQKLTPEEIEKSKVIEYHIYDIEGTDLGYNDRMEIIRDWLIDHPSPYLKLLESIQISNPTQDQLDHYHAYFTELGFEGMMVRAEQDLYSNSRSKSLLKMKAFEDGEFEIIDIEEGRGNRANTVGAIVCRDEFGVIFRANLRGTDEYKLGLWNNKQEAIGQFCTVRYQNKTPDGSYRFPVMITIRHDI